MRKIKPAVIGKDGRTTALIKIMGKSPLVGGEHNVICLDGAEKTSDEKTVTEAVERAIKLRPDFVVVGPEEPLALGIVDRLEAVGIPCIGPTQNLAQLESSKAFTRELVREYKIAGNPKYRIFKSLEGIEDYIRTLDSGYVVKPDGLTGGKGVKVSDSHLFSIEDGVEYCRELLEVEDSQVVIEEKLDGEEFSLMSFCDGDCVVDMVPIQDHKRVGEGDTGPNTGGMGSYSCEDHSLPFLSPQMLAEASAINAAVAKALKQKTGESYRGILYGGFMITSKGLCLLEYNARFGDPETMNALSVLKTDLVEIFQAMIAGTLAKVEVTSRKQATVCKYLVPEGYPNDTSSTKNKEIFNIPAESENLKIFPAAVNIEDGRWYLTGSRAVAIVGVGDNLDEAERIAEQAASQIGGPVFHRRDIGTHALIDRRIEHVQQLGIK
jgi:fusion protein PurCD